MSVSKVALHYGTRAVVVKTMQTQMKNSAHSDFGAAVTVV